MRVLLDESLPRPLARQIVGHDARTVSQMQWTSLGNGALLKQAATAFDVLLTADQNIEFQQNLTTLPIAIVVLVAESNRLESLELPWEPPATPIIHARVLPSRCSNRLPILFEPSFARHHTSS